MDIIETVFVRNNLVVAFAVVGITIWISYLLADKLTAGRIHGSAIAIALGLVAAYFGGIATGGSTGVADIALLGGIGLMGGDASHTRWPCLLCQPADAGDAMAAAAPLDARLGQPP